MSTTPSSVKINVSSEQTNSGLHLEATAYNGTTPVGDFDAFETDDPYSLQANELYVPPAERRKGIGEALVRELSQAAKDKQFIQLESRITSPEALAVRKKVFGETALRFFDEAPGTKQPIELPLSYQQASESLKRAQSRKFSKSSVDKSIGVVTSLESILPSESERMHAFTEVAEDDPTLEYGPFEELQRTFNIPIQNTDNMYSYFVEHDEESLLHDIYDASNPAVQERVPATINLMKLKEVSPDMYTDAAKAAAEFQTIRDTSPQDRDQINYDVKYLEMHYQMSRIYDALMQFEGATEASVKKLFS